MLKLSLYKQKLYRIQTCKNAGAKKSLLQLIIKFIVVAGTIVYKIKGKSCICPIGKTITKYRVCSQHRLPVKKRKRNTSSCKQVFFFESSFLFFFFFFILRPC